MALDFLLIFVGIALLYFGGGYLVKGSVGLSLRYGIPPMIVGLTVMAFGTSAPELFVSVRAAMTGHGDLAFGNIVGSNIANILLIIGVPAIIAPLRTDGFNSVLPWSEAMFASLMLWLLVQFSPFEFWQGAVLLFFFAVVLGAQIYRANKGMDEQNIQVDETTKDHPLPQIILWLILGVILLPTGGEFMVRGAVDIARHFGVSEAIIGLTILAIGTSLPELAASIMAAEHGETEMAVGNVLGSCLFNILLILGVTGVLSTSVVDESLVRFDIPVMILSMGILGLFVLNKWVITRGAGVVLVLAYLAYLAKLVWL